LFNSGYNNSMRDTWTLQDILDLDYFCTHSLDNDTRGEDQHKTAREIFLAAERHGNGPPLSHLQCLRIWLAHQRTEHTSTSLSPPPGKWLEEVLCSFKYLLLLSGLLFGCGLGLSYFAYTGRTPLNVFTFFTVFILPQLLLLAIFLLHVVAAKLTRQPRNRLQQLTMPVFIRFVGMVKRFAPAGLTAENRQSFSRQLVEKNSILFVGPLFISSQLFGIAFNIGLVAVTLFKVITTDLAFGWQTTLQFGTEKLYFWVQVLAWPWSWLPAADVSLPTPAQIEGSRIILKDGIYHLLTENLTSWWPFLLLCLLCYGLLPRLLLLLYGFFLKRRIFHRFLGQRQFRAISRRMLTPLVSTQAVAPPSPRSSAVEGDIQNAVVHTEETAPKHDCVVLVPDEIFAVCNPEILLQLLSPLGYQAVERRRILRNYEEDRSMVEGISRVQLPLIVLFEAWMPPIREHLLLLKKLDEALPDDIPLAICLLGKPSAAKPYNRARPGEIRLWQKMIRQYCRNVLILEPQPSSPTVKDPRHDP
jgi:hypothetical protein